MKRVTLFDYGAGNLHSLSKALETEGTSVAAETDPIKAVDTDILVLPGVGAFAHACERLAPGLETMRGAIRAGLPTLGICLGMQLLFSESDEGPGEGLGVLPGRVTKLRADRVPQIGWNTIDAVLDPAIAGAGLTTAYYANSYVCRPREEECVVAWTTHERDRFPAAVRSGATLGVQFHPEKSSTAGVAMLRRFIMEVR